MAQIILNDLSSRSTFRNSINSNFTELYDGPTLTDNQTTTLGSFSYSIQSDNLGATSTDKILFDNNTDAAAGAQQYSPFVRQRARGWKTNATSGSQTVDFDFGVTSTQGSTNPTGNWLLRTAINGAAYTTAINVSSDITNFGIAFCNGATSILGTTNSTILLSGSSIVRFSGSQGAIQYNLTSLSPVSTGAISIRNFNANATMTSGTHSEIGMGSGFSPTSGTCIYNMLIVQNTINQTGGANGQVTFFNINPTIASSINITGFDWNPSADGSTSNYAFRARKGDITIEDPVRGLILKDTQATPHFWRVKINNVGVLTTTDIGTSL
jgi:hypothetical protein